MKSRWQMANMYKINSIQLSEFWSNLQFSNTIHGFSRAYEPQIKPIHCFLLFLTGLYNILLKPETQF